MSKRWLSHTKNIVLILIIIGLPFAGLEIFRILQRMQQQAKIDKAVGVIVNELRAARYLAVTQNRYVAIIMPTVQDANFGGVTSPAYKGRSLRLCLLHSQPDYDPNAAHYHGRFSSYLNDRPWQFLPESFFIGYTPTHGEFLSGDMTSRCNVVNYIPFPATDSMNRVDRVRALIFSPSGEAVASPQGNGARTMDTEIIIHRGKIGDGNKLLRWGVDADVRTITVYQLTGDFRVD